MEHPTIQYAGESRELKITNSTMLRFKRLGGNIKHLEEDPVEQVILLACAAFNLEGDPIEHADKFPPVFELAEPIRDAMQIYNGGQPGEPIGAAPGQSQKSATG